MLKKYKKSYGDNFTVCKEDSSSDKNPSAIQYP